jgi:ribosomal protein L12E/L44/L45/RPP1/RPP2
MTCACIFACIAQFAPLPFPTYRYVLGACGALYFVLSGVLQCVSFLVDQDAILITKPFIDIDDDELEELLNEQDEGAESKPSGGSKAIKKGVRSRKSPEKGKKKEAKTSDAVEDENAVDYDLFVPIRTDENADMSKYGVRVRTELKRYTEWYTITLQFQLPTTVSNIVYSLRQKHFKPPPEDEDLTVRRLRSCVVSQKYSIGNFFDKNGNFDELSLVLAAEELLKRFVSCQYNNDKKVKKE